MHVALSGLALIAGVAAVGGALWRRSARWIDRRYRHALVLRRAMAIIGATLGVSAAAALLGGHGALSDAGMVFAGVAMAALQYVAQDLRRLPTVALRPRRILAVGAHPDDLELACGATLARLVDEGHEVRALVMSRGSAGGHAPKRTREAMQGARYVGIDAVDVHDFDDTRLAGQNDEMIAVIENAITTFRPDVILTHSAHDHHQDHVAVHAACLRAGRRIGSILCFESPSATRDFNPSFFVDVDEYLRVKARSVELHADQARKPYMAKDVILSTATFRGSQARLVAAEGFEVVRLDGASLLAL